MFRARGIRHDGRDLEEVIRRLNVHLVREAELLYLCGEKQKNERSTKENPPPSHPSTARATAAIPAADEETTKPSGRNKRYRGDRQTTVKCGVFKASRLLETCDQRPAAASPTSSTPRVRVSSVYNVPPNVTCVVCTCASH